MDEFLAGRGSGDKVLIGLATLVTKRDIARNLETPSLLKLKQQHAGMDWCAEQEEPIYIAWGCSAKLSKDCTQEDAESAAPIGSLDLTKEYPWGTKQSQVSPPGSTLLPQVNEKKERTLPGGCGQLERDVERREKARWQTKNVEQRRKENKMLNGGRYEEIERKEVREPEKRKEEGKETKESPEEPVLPGEGPEARTHRDTSSHVPAGTCYSQVRSQGWHWIKRAQGEERNRDGGLREKEAL
ncbi:hypothetical protein NDU88_000350 [Pleurodeles waltl]|uniref:Uncharacterized protein n=1 Tax=Pleurodeles waltl TaxID=8319 RepID=A0AAV7S4B6_PLEWA|nr:hypothetical protein NDU88_000350 [Pleurodeles waltl]